MHLMLFRPLVDFQVSHQVSKENDETRGLTFKKSTGSEVKIKKYSQAQCWESVRRTSLLDEYPETLRMIGQTPAITHIGVQCFTAGVMLGTFALSDPSSDQAQECKRGLARLIKTPSSFGFPENPVWNQSTQILKELLHLIGREEMKTLLTTDIRSPLASQSIDIAGRDSETSLLRCNSAFAYSVNTINGSTSMSQETLAVDAHLETQLALDMSAQSAWPDDDEQIGPNFDSLGTAIASVQQFMHGMGQPNVTGVGGGSYSVASGTTETETGATSYLQFGPVTSNLSWQHWIWDYNTYS
ncbi:hypothetical protein PT974_01762 [Cladobotryum mycophilum]|uniref:Transcription factor domain-containing protein n=1 Tax=Cladobotryum mycophilum TaxID=491253 RepID=A0ABR0SW98_9HYPO